MLIRLEHKELAKKAFVFQLFAGLVKRLATSNNHVGAAMLVKRVVHTPEHVEVAGLVKRLVNFNTHVETARFDEKLVTQINMFKLQDLCKDLLAEIMNQIIV